MVKNFSRLSIIAFTTSTMHLTASVSKPIKQNGKEILKGL
jgi:hypothetical protein